MPHVAEPNLHEAWGISFADAAEVRDALDPTNDQTFDTHSVISRPLLCLLCQYGHGDVSPSGSPEAAFRALKRLQASRKLKGVHAVEFIREGPEPILVPQLPRVFAEAEAILRDEVEGRRIERTQALAERYPDLAGVMITRDRDEG